jgi:metallo-beta-lactamase family protein
MGVEISHIHSDFRENYDDETSQTIGKADLFGTSRVTFASSVKDSQKINSDSGPCVIVASSPTCEFGRILHHLSYSIERPNDMVLFVGWTPPRTLGRRLQDGEKRVRIFDRWYEVKCQVKTIHGLSAHADSDELLRFLKPALTPSTDLYIVHGEPDQAEQLASRLLTQGAGTTIVPAMLTTSLTPGFRAATAQSLKQIGEAGRDE